MTSTVIWCLVCLSVGIILGRSSKAMRRLGELHAAAHSRNTMAVNQEVNVSVASAGGDLAGGAVGTVRADGGDGDPARGLHGGVHGRSLTSRTVLVEDDDGVLRAVEVLREGSWES